MLALKKKSASLALSTGLVLTIAACGNGDDGVGQDSNADVAPVAELSNLTGVSTEVEVDPSFLSAAQSLGVTPGTVGDAQLQGATLSFPITGGDVTYYDPTSDRDPFVEGEIEHEGSGLSLTAEGTTVELTDFVVDPGESVLRGTVTRDDEVVEESADLFFLDGRTLEPLQTDDGTAVLQGTTVSLTAEAADLLNDVFEVEAFEEFLLVGIATITLALPGEQGTTTSPTAVPTVTEEATTPTPEATDDATEDDEDDAELGEDSTPTPSPTS